MKTKVLVITFVLAQFLQFQVFAQPGNVVYGNNSNMPGGIANTGVGENLRTTHLSSVENSLSEGTSGK